MSLLSHELTPVQRFSGFIILVVLGCSVALLWSSTEFLGRAVGAALSLGALCLAVIVSLRKEESANRVRRYSLYFGMAVSLAVIAPTPIQLWLAALSQQALHHYSIELPIAPQLLSSTTPVLVFAWAVIAIVNATTIDWSAMRRHPRRNVALFRDRTVKERLKLLCRDLRVELDDIEARTDWRHTYYVSLDAEVDVMRGLHRRRRVEKLIQALKGHPNARLFLLLGDPGGGKSVALRKLCRDLLEEVDATGRIPLYVNLREWRPTGSWTPESPPTFDELRSFVFESLSQSLAGRSREFFQRYFDDLVDHGHVFFLLDSFDEIPDVLDNTNADWLVRELSKVVSQLLIGGHDSRGVVASRFYRSPELPGDDYVVLEVRPFSDYQIGKAVDLASANSERLKWLLFRERPEWISYARNPFTLGLMVQYVDQHQTLPATRAVLFEHTIDRALTLVSSSIERAGLTKDDVVRASEAIAAEMLASENGGLDVPVARLRDRLSRDPIEDVVNILEVARIVRVTRPQRMLSFVHRRFNEFFLIADFQRDRDKIPLAEIPTDGRLRDALVLYTEVAETEHARNIAEFCWTYAGYLARSEADVGGGYIAALHALRFLSDAFRRRRESLVAFIDELAAMIRGMINDSGDLLVIKHSVEAAGLLSGEQLEQCLTATLDRRVSWLSETAFRSTKYLGELERETEARIFEYLLELPVHYQISRWRELHYNLSLSAVFVKLRTRFTVAVVWYLVNGGALLGCVVLVPKAVLMAAGVAISSFLIWGAIDIAVGRVRGRRILATKLSDFNKDVTRVVMAISLVLGLMLAFALFFDFTRSAVRPGLVVVLEQMGVTRDWLQRDTEDDKGNFLEMFGWAAFGEPLGGGAFVGMFGGGSDVWAVAVCVVASIPMQRMLIPGIMGRWWIGVRAMLKASSVFKGTMILALVVGMLYLPKWLVVRVLAVMSVLSAAIVAVVVCVGLGKGVAGMLADRRELAMLRTKFDGSREKIAEGVASLQTAGARVAFLRWVDDQQRVKEIAEKLRSPENAWPGGRRPNWGDDEASEYLARLDERWLGLQQRS